MYILVVRMAKRVRVPVSSARSRLFDLLDMVRASDGSATVVLEQRGKPDGIALVREARLAYLEERVMHMDEQHEAAFTLGGSLAAEVDDATLELALRDLRMDWGVRPWPNPPAAGARKRGVSRRPRR